MVSKDSAMRRRSDEASGCRPIFSITGQALSTVSLSHCPVSRSGSQANTSYPPAKARAAQPAPMTLAPAIPNVWILPIITLLLCDREEPCDRLADCTVTPTSNHLHRSTRYSKTKRRKLRVAARGIEDRTPVNPARQSSGSDRLGG